MLVLPHLLVDTDHYMCLILCQSLLDGRNGWWKGNWIIFESHYVYRKAIWYLYDTLTIYHNIVLLHPAKRVRSVDSSFSTRIVYLRIQGNRIHCWQCKQLVLYRTSIIISLQILLHVSCSLSYTFPGGWTQTLQASHLHETSHKPTFLLSNAPRYPRCLGILHHSC